MRGMPPGAVPARPGASRLACTLIIDAGDDLGRDDGGATRSSAALHRLSALHDLLEAYGAVPTYLLPAASLDDPVAVRALRHELEGGRCDAGLLFRPDAASPGAAAQDARLAELIRRFRQAFARLPSACRIAPLPAGLDAGALLERHGIRVDTSIVPRIDLTEGGGPDNRAIGSAPFWFGPRHAVLAVPPSRDVVGRAGGILPAWLARACHAAPIALAPEDTGIAAMQRLARGLVRRGQGLLALGFRSSSLVAGRNIAVPDQPALHHFHDRLSALMTYLADAMGAEFIPLATAPGRFAPPATAPAG